MGAAAARAAAPARTRPRRAPAKRRPARGAAPRSRAPKRPNQALASLPRARRAHPARRARPATRPLHPMRFAQPAAAGAAMLPHAAVRTADAVRDLSDSSLIVRLTQGRAWIAALGVLLAGIVALNVLILSLNSGVGVAGEKIDLLERQNSALRAELAEKLSSVRVEEEGAALGMSVPQPEDTSYLRARHHDAKRAARALDGG
jgi:hypothetical protein